jgi:hypothetical protein
MTNSFTNLFGSLFGSKNGDVNTGDVETLRRYINENLRQEYVRSKKYALKITEKAGVFSARITLDMQADGSDYSNFGTDDFRQLSFLETGYIFDNCLKNPPVPTEFILELVFGKNNVAIVQRSLNQEYGTLTYLGQSNDINFEDDTPSPQVYWVLDIDGEEFTRFNRQDIMNGLHSLERRECNFVILERKKVDNPNSYTFMQSAVANAGPYIGMYVVGCGFPGSEGPKYYERCVATMNEVFKYFQEFYEEHSINIYGFEDASEMLH